MNLQEAEIHVLAVLDKMGFKMVELSQYQKGGRSHLQLVVHKLEGVTMEDCVSIHKILFPRLEMAFEKEDVYLEISSPGLGRKIKKDREYSIFKGRVAKIFLDGESDWLKGKIVEADEEGVTLEIGQEKRTIPYGSIQKGKLDFDKEIR